MVEQVEFIVEHPLKMDDFGLLAPRFFGFIRKWNIFKGEFIVISLFSLTSWSQDLCNSKNRPTWLIFHHFWKRSSNFKGHLVERSSAFQGFLHVFLFN